MLCLWNLCISFLDPLGNPFFVFFGVYEEERETFGPQYEAKLLKCFAAFSRC